MNYKINRLTEYGVFLLQHDTEFVRGVFHEYFRTYVDNYYYGIFNTIDEEHFTMEHLKLELNGIEKEMLEEYRAYELVDSNSDYSNNQKYIHQLNSLCLELIKIDFLNITKKEDIFDQVSNFFQENSLLSRYLDGRIQKFCSLVRETFLTVQKLLVYSDNYYVVSTRKFENNKEIDYLELTPNIKVLDIYKSGMISRIYQDPRLEEKKLECIIQKISLYILKKLLNKEKINQVIIEVHDSIISRGKIQDNILSLLNNPLFKKYVILGVSYNNYLNQKSAFLEDFTYACIQDFSHINDVYLKVDNINNEGIFKYLIISDCKYKDREYFLKFENDSLQLLVFEEE